MRSRRRGNAREAKIFSHLVDEEEIGKDFFTPPPTCPSTPPPSEAELPPTAATLPAMPLASPQFPPDIITDDKGQNNPLPPDFRCESLPQLSRTVKVSPLTYIYFLYIIYLIFIFIYLYFYLFIYIFIFFLKQNEIKKKMTLVNRKKIIRIQKKKH